jgi:hypothetical protein
MIRAGSAQNWATIWVTNSRNRQTCTFTAANLAFPLEEYLVQRSGRCIVSSFSISVNRKGD